MDNNNSGEPLDISPIDRDLAIRTMIGEESSPVGLAGVASTILNRATHGGYGGKSVSGVTLAPGQFEPWERQPAALLSISPDDPRYQRAGQIFDGVASGSIPDYTNGATHFYAPAAQSALGRSAPAWAKGKGTQLGATMFFAPNGPVQYKAPAAQAIAGATSGKGAQVAAADDFLRDFPVAGPAQSPAAKGPTAAPTTAAPVTAGPDFLSDFPVADAAAPVAAAPTVRNPGFLPPGVPIEAATIPAATSTPLSMQGKAGQNPLDVAQQLGQYLGGQAAGVPGAIGQDFTASAGLAGQGIHDIASGNVLPTFPSWDPNSWHAGGALETAAGAAGALTSPITGAVHQLIEQPVTNATGSPAIGAGAALAVDTMGAPLVGRVAGRAFGDATIGTLDPETARLASMARDHYGIPVNAGQLSASPATRFAASALNRLPFSGAEGDAAVQQAAFNRAAAATIGEKAEKLTPDVMNRAKARIGQVFDDVAQNTTLQVDSQFAQDLHDVINRANLTLTKPEADIISRQAMNIYNTIDQRTGTISGQTYQALTKHGAPLYDLTENDNSNLSNAAQGLRSALDGMLQRSAPADVQAALSNAKYQYRNLMTLKPLAAKAPTGDISPALLQGAVNTNTGNALAFGGGGDLGNLARIGQRFLKEPPSSGTAERASVLAMLYKMGQTAGGLALGSHALGMTPAEMGLSAAAVPASIIGGRVIGGTLRSQWLANSLINRSLNGPPSGLSLPLSGLGALGGATNLLNKPVNSLALPYQQP